jgi:DnaJ-class molecular chaperone
MKKQKSKSSIELERVCPRCRGAGGEKRDYDNVWDTCVQCGGSGYLVTAMGERVIALIEHNLKPILINAGGKILSGR